MLHTLQVLQRIVNLFATWYIIKDFSAIFREFAFIGTCLSCVYIVFVIEAVYSFAKSYLRTRPGLILLSMASPHSDHPRLTDLCPVCLDSMTHSSSCVTPCDHVFHRTCLIMWLNVSLKCPACRMPFNVA